MLIQPGKLVRLRGRDWIVLPSDDADVMMVKPLGGFDNEITGIYLPLTIASEKPVDAQFKPPSPDDLGNIGTARILYDAARLAFRNGAGPFRSLAKLSFRPRSYQMVPLIMALRQDRVRLLIADDVGVGKTVESLLIVREFLERRRIRQFAVICLPHLCDQWQMEIRDKLDLEAVIIRSNTQARLDREIQGDASVFDYYPYQVISIDFIKSEHRRDIFIEQCPEMVIVDEVHACARPSGSSKTRQQRHYLISRIASREDRQLIMLTATPHSGKPMEFQSLLGLLKPEFETLDLPQSSQSRRRDLARYFIQRKRADVEKWMGENTPFPVRDAFEYPYDLSVTYNRFFEKILDFARKLVIPDHTGGEVRKAHYWTALALLRGVMSSPAAGMDMLNTRLFGLGEMADDENADVVPDNPVADTEFGFEGDTTPTPIMEKMTWSDWHRQKLRDLGGQLSLLANPDADQKLASAAHILKEWLSQKFNPVVFCRYIATANYLGDHLMPLLKARFSNVDIQVITSEIPDDLRRQKIDEMGRAPLHVLIATDCLSEGINLQQLFTAVLHYDLPWNPNRLEQREGRVDRFGQISPEVRTCLLYGADNPIDGIVLEVLLRKVREIKKATGINVPFPEDSQSIIDTITQALLLNPDRKIRKQRDNRQLQFDFAEFDEAATAKANVTRKLDEAAAREKASRSIFSQNAIKSGEIEMDLREMDVAIGDPQAVEMFVVHTLENLFGVQVIRDKTGYRIVMGNMPVQLKDLLPEGDTVRVSFESPTPQGCHYLGRNNRFVEQLCQLVMANTLDRAEKRAARSAVIRTRQVAVKTTIVLFRCRNVIEDQKKRHQIVAEEMMLWGWRGSPQQPEFLDHEKAGALLDSARASSNLSPQARTAFLTNELGILKEMTAEFDAVAERQSQKLVAAHERFSALMDGKRFQVVYPVLPMDLLGVYILLPEDRRGTLQNPPSGEGKNASGREDGDGRPI